MRPLQPLAIGCGLTLFAAALTLGACQKSAEPDAEATSSLSAASDARPGLSLSEARLVLPAVGGHPGAVYFTLRNAGAAPAKVAAIQVDGAARAEMHETGGGTMRPIASLEVPPGGTIAFAPGGRHVMVFGLAPVLVAGGSTEMMVSLANGDKLSAPVTVRPPGDGGIEPMTMDMH